MNWSKVNKKTKKPIGWWYHKLMCEFWYNYFGTSNRRYYDHLEKMVKKYNLNLYGDVFKQSNKHLYHART